MVYAGAVLCAAGIWVWSRPAAIVFLGMTIMVAGLFASRRRG